MRQCLDDHREVLVDELAEVLRLEEGTEALKRLCLHLCVVILSKFALDVDELDELRRLGLLHADRMLSYPIVQRVYGLQSFVPVIGAARVYHILEVLHELRIYGF